MGNWGDDSDFEAKSMQEYQGRFTINFKNKNALYMHSDTFHTCYYWFYA